MDFLPRKAYASFRDQNGCSHNDHGTFREINPNVEACTQDEMRTKAIFRAALKCNTIINYKVYSENFLRSRLFARLQITLANFACSADLVIQCSLRNDDTGGQSDTD